jgi:hypothetical protein
MMPSSFCTVAARVAAATHWPFCKTSRLAATRSASGAQILVEDRNGQFHAFARAVRIDIPVGHDHAARTVGLQQRHEGQRIQRGAPQIAVDADGRHLACGKIGLGPFLAAASGQCQYRSRDQDELVKTHVDSSRFRCDCRRLYSPLLAWASFRETEPRRHVKIRCKSADSGFNRNRLLSLCNNLGKSGRHG